MSHIFYFLSIPSFHSKLLTPNSKLLTPNSKLLTPNSKLPKVRTS